jgi:hypothetical protein
MKIVVTSVHGVGGVDGVVAIEAHLFAGELDPLLIVQRVQVVLKLIVDTVIGTKTKVQAGFQRVDQKNTLLGVEIIWIAGIIQL